ncbi:hypothetical protein Tco_0170401, partial [Tanacetum coccineum]
DPTEVVVGRFVDVLKNVGEGVLTISLPLFLVAACDMNDVVLLGGGDGNGACCQRECEMRLSLNHVLASQLSQTLTILVEVEVN